MICSGDGTYQTVSVAIEILFNLELASILTYSFSDVAFPFPFSGAHSPQPSTTEPTAESPTRSAGSIDRRLMAAISVLFIVIIASFVALNGQVGDAAGAAGAGMLQRNDMMPWLLSSRCVGIRSTRVAFIRKHAFDVALMMC